MFKIKNIYPALVFAFCLASLEQVSALEKRGNTIYSFLASKLYNSSFLQYKSASVAAFLSTSLGIYFAGIAPSIGYLPIIFSFYGLFSFTHYLFSLAVDLYDMYRTVALFRGLEQGLHTNLNQDIGDEKEMPGDGERGSAIMYVSVVAFLLVVGAWAYYAFAYQHKEAELYEAVEIA